MFDSPFDDWMPGRVTLFGWPWHGRLDLRAGITGPKPKVTLPNAVQFELDFDPTQTAILTAHQPGNLLRFRDPRAVDVERTTDQLAADAERGVEWRADALYGPREGLVYGKPITPFTGARRWIYHDGERNWFASYGGISVQIRPLPTVRRRTVSEGQLTLSISYPEGSPSTPAGSYEWVVIDALTDGTRVILARLRTDISTMPTGAYSTTGGLAWRQAPREFWEIELVNDPEEGRSAIMRPLRTVTQTAGTVIPRVVPELVDGDISYSITWVIDSENDGVYEWVGTVDDFAVISVPAGTGSSRGMANVGAYNITHGHTGQVLSLYYRPDGSVAELTISALCEEAYNCTFTASQTSSEARTRNGSDSIPGGTTATLLEEGEITITASASLTVARTLTVKLAADGVETESHVTTASVSNTGEATAVQTFPVSVAQYWLFDLVSASRDHSITSDYASPVASGAGSDAFTVANGSLRVGPWDAGYWPTFSGAWASLQPSQSSARLVSGAVSYCAHMPAIASLAQPAPGDPPANWLIGQAACPGGIVAGSQTGSGAMTEVFGSYNPITQATIRDAANPVTWV